MSGLPVASNRYFDSNFQRPGVKLLPNEFFVTREDMVLATVLGSCVAACIQDPVAGIGGMNHFMLPDDGADSSRATSDSMRYGAYAMEVLLNELIKGGARRERLEAKVFGGAAVLAAMTTLNIGDRNSEFVRRYLALEKVRITAEDLQGQHPRKVCFMPATGQVMVKKLRAAHETQVTELEHRLAREMRERRAERSRERVELFAKPARPGLSGTDAARADASRPKVELFGRPATTGTPAGTGRGETQGSPTQGKTMEEA
jgi:chemotaxis protein CheD